MGAALLFIIVIALLEFGYEYRRDWRVCWFDLFRAGVLWFGSLVSGLFAVVLIAELTLSGFAWSNPAPWAVQLVGGFLLADYCWYWFHRLCHGPRLWKWHYWHHVTTRLNVWMTWLGHPVFYLGSALMRLLPLWAFGVDASVVLIVGAAQIIITATAHLNVTWHTPLLSRYVVTPEVHRWHHTLGSRRNFGLCLAVWDRFHETYAYKPHGPICVGVREPLNYPPEHAIVAHLTYPME